MSRVYFTSTPDSLALTSPYDRDFVDALKARVPYQARKWSKPHWLIDPAYGAAVADLCRDYFGVRPTVPATVTLLRPTTRVLKLEYLARCKDRGDGDSAANGWVDGGWNARFPESVLRDWFHASAANGPSAREAQPSATKQRPPDTLYALLGVAPNVGPADLKKSWRRMLLQWHPDHCKEPNAQDMTIQIQEAYDLLRDPARRKRYDAGLKLQATLTPVPDLFRTRQAYVDLQTALDSYDTYGYRAPLRCGLVVCEGTPRLGRFIANAIKAWEDIVDGAGRVMVSSWPEGAEMFEVDWIDPDQL